jgi:hypothetical protein
MTIQSRSESSFGKSTLPAGLEADGCALSCVVSVYDSLMSSQSADYSVTVVPLVISTADLSDLVFSQLNASSGSSDKTKQVLATASTVLNSVDCSLAPDCASLNRHNCSATSQTCGSCLADYDGVSGDVNSRCSSLSTLKSDAGVTDSSGAGLVNVVCATDDDCGLWGKCDTSSAAPFHCMRLLQICPGNQCVLGTGRVSITIWTE